MTERLLIVGPAWVGDMVMAQGLFRFLHQHHEDVTIDVLAPAWSLPLLARMPEVNQAIVMPISHGELALRKRYQMAKQLREKKYTQAIALPNSFKSALIPFWAKIPKRTGYRGEMRYGLLNDLRLLDAKRYPLMIERFVALGLSCGETLPKTYPWPALQISNDAREKVIQKFHLNMSQPVLVMCPGAEFGPAKRWPERYFATVAERFVTAGWQVWLLGSTSDRAVTEMIEKLSNVSCVNLAGQTTLEEAIDLISFATKVLTNDSGLMHIAAALDKPIVAVYGPTSPHFTPPLHLGSKVLQLSLPCQPCFERVCPLKHHHCMEQLLPQKILSALTDES
ncbi:MAG: lipopolysaccharide heptosyltransferase II [Gammaproteobacteria bacterium]|nr:lipopolysaccharide heptosyltransferase II [Gammaproteobacteria bacterium]